MNARLFCVTLGIAGLFGACELVSSETGREKNDAVTQERACECLPPYVFRVFVRNDEIVDVQFEMPEATYGLSVEALAENARRAARTVDEVFAALDSLLSLYPATFRVTYDAAFGYPTDVFVDIDARTADEEFILSLSDLTF